MDRRLYKQTGRAGRQAVVVRLRQTKKQTARRNNKITELKRSTMPVVTLPWQSPFGRQQQQSYFRAVIVRFIQTDRQANRQNSKKTGLKRSIIPVVTSPWQSAFPR